MKIWFVCRKRGKFGIEHNYELIKILYLLFLSDRFELIKFKEMSKKPNFKFLDFCKKYFIRGFILKENQFIIHYLRNPIVKNWFLQSGKTNKLNPLYPISQKKIAEYNFDI